MSSNRGAPRGSQPAGSGLLLVDKPGGMTSHDVVSRCRRLAQTRRVGHGGTLDPMATGLLIVGVNAGTKLLQYASGSSKTYRATMRFGVSTVTDDAEGEVVGAPGQDHLDAADFAAVTENYRGQILQVPNSVSAIKINGKRSYARVRAGEDVKLAARPVTVTRLALLTEPRLGTTEVGGRTVSIVDVDVEIDCSSGTYIRALARDIGRDLGGGGHLTALRRTAIGPWTVEEAQPLSALEEEVERGSGLPLISVEQSCKFLFPAAVVSEAAAARFRHGTAPGEGELVATRGAQRGSGPAETKGNAIHAVVSAENPDEVLGLIQNRPDSGLGWKTVSVFASPST